jgi:flavin reductase (DIM6/NTAB) family NADH-FMN oxidoreductase RutF
MNLTSGDYDPSVNEFDVAKLATRPSQLVRPPQVAASPISFECRLHKVLDFGDAPPSGSLVIGEIVSVHMDENVLGEGRLDPQALDLIGRMGGIEYTRTTQRFELQRPKV